MLSETEIFENSTKANLSEFGAEFANFSRSAYRLELYPRFHVPHESGAIEAFERGDPPSPAFNAEWHQTLRAALERNAEFHRIRGLPRTSNSYLNFEIKWGYSANIKAGEKIGFLYTDEIESTIGQDYPLPDVWVFDGKRAYVLCYDFRGGFYGALRLEEVVSKQLYAALIDLEKMCRGWEWLVENYVRDNV